MANNIDKTQLPLSVFEVSLEFVKSSVQILVSLQQSDRDEAELQWNLPAGEFGIPQDVKNKFNYEAGDFTFPNEFVEELICALSELGVSNESPLWLRLGEPSGYLNFVPWERLIAHHIDVPILRLPHFKVDFRKYANDADVVICSSVPAARGKVPFDASEYVIGLIESYRASLHSDFTLHLFIDSDHYDKIKSWRELQDDKSRIRIYDPQEADKFSSQRGSKGPSDKKSVKDNLANPWLQWIEDELAKSNRFADVVHFVNHGYFRNDQGFIAVAETPTKNQDMYWSRFIGIYDLSEFLNRTGALSVFFTAPRSNYSNIGTRALAAQVARQNAVDVVCHESLMDEEFDELRRIQEFIFAGDAREAPQSLRSASICCQPQRVKNWSPVLGTPRSTGGQLESIGTPTEETFEIADDMRKAFDDAKMLTPKWVYSAQSYLEKQSVESRNRKTKRSKSQTVTDRSKVETLKKIREVMLNSIRNIKKNKEDGKQ